MPDQSTDLFGASPAAPRQPEPHVFTVAEVTRAVRTVLEHAFDEIWVQGETSNYRQQASGHQYFTLKDSECQLPCVRFARPGLWRKNIALQDGMQVQVRGRLTVYEARGQYQLNVSIIQPAGAGLLQARFEALKRKLAAEGLFDTARKRPIPRFPRTLGMVTSPSGAALRDILNVLSRRAPWLRVIISPARVQGDGAAAEMITALQDLERLATLGVAPVDVILVTRGGGSMEDLWEFNDEALARALCTSSIPIVSAVGHEIDFTIADFVADLRAPTPSAAAELIAPDTAEILRQLQQRAAFLHRHVANSIASSLRHLTALARSALFREPQQRLQQLAQQLDAADQSLTRAAKAHLAKLREALFQNAANLRHHRPEQQIAMFRHRLGPLTVRVRDSFQRQLQLRRERLQRLSEMLRLLSPRHTLERGYTLTTDASGQLLRSATEVTDGSVLVTSFHDGKVESVTKSKGPTERSPNEPRKRKDKSKPGAD